MGDGADAGASGGRDGEMSHIGKVQTCIACMMVIKVGWCRGVAVVGDGAQAGAAVGLVTCSNVAMCVGLFVAALWRLGVARCLVLIIA
jgi:hypothetical protein